MTNNQKFYINGQWVNPNSVQLLDVINPANEEVISEGGELKNRFKKLANIL